jgi:SH3-like domain-containing protein
MNRVFDMRTSPRCHKLTQPITTTLLFSAFIFFLLSSPSLAQMLSIKGDKVNMRSGPGIQNKIKWEYGAGFPFEVLKKQGDWLNVKDFENDTGWIHKSHLQSAPHIIVKVNKDQEKTINIRSGPGNEHPIVGNAYHGVVFAKVEEKSNWVKVRHESGLTGWVSKSLLWGF